MKKKKGRKPTTSRTPSKVSARTRKTPAPAQNIEQKGIGAAFGFANWPIPYSGLKGHTTPNDAELVNEYVNNDIVKACIDKSANGVSSLEWKALRQIAQRKSITGTTEAKAAIHKLHQLKAVASRAKYKRFDLVHKYVDDNADVEEVTAGPLVDFLWSIDINAIQRDLDLMGKAYLLKVYATSSYPIDSIVLPAERIKENRDKNTDEVISYTLTKDKGKKDTFPAEEVVAFHNDFKDGEYTSPLKAAWGKVQVASKLTEYENAMLNNRARPDIAIVFDDAVSPEDQKRITKDFEQKNRGRKSGAPWNVPVGCKIVPLNYSPTELASLEMGEEAMKAMAGSTGIPTALMGKDATYSNMEASMRLWAENGRRPRVLKIEQVINENIVPEFDPSENVFVAFENPVPEDKAFEQEEKKRISSDGVITIDELRAIDGFEPVGPENGGSVLVADLRKASTVNPVVATADPVAEEEDVEEEIDEDNEGKHFDRLSILNKAVAAGELPRAIAINQAVKFCGLTDEAAKHLVAFNPEPKVIVKVQRPNAVAAPYAKLEGVVKKHLSKMAEYYKGKVSKEFISAPPSDSILLETKSLPEKFTPISKWDAEFAHEVKPVIELTAQSAGKKKASELAKVGASPDAFSVMPAKIDEGMDSLSLKLAKSTTDNIAGDLNEALDKIREELAQGIRDEGESIDELTKRIGEIVDDPARAEMIARSETQRAVHYGQKVAAKESGIVKGFTWLASDDACPVCQELDGKDISLDGEFADFGYGDNDQPPAHPNCTCTMLDVLNDEGDAGDSA